MDGSKQRLRVWVVEVCFTRGNGNDDAIQNASRKLRDASVNNSRFSFSESSTHRDVALRYRVDAVSVTNALLIVEEMMRSHGELDLFDSSGLITIHKAVQISA